MKATIAILKTRKIKKWIQTAMLTLLEEKEYEKITITEISKRADISRFGFYSYYKNKEEILIDITSYICELSLAKHSEIRNENKTNYEEFWNEVLNTFMEHKTFLTLLQKNNLIHIWIKAMLTTMDHLNQQYNIADNELSQFFNLYHGVGIIHLFLDFINRNPDISVPEMTKIIMQLRQDPYRDIYLGVPYF